MMQAFMERFVFPWLDYTDGSLKTAKKMPVAFIYTMNAPESLRSSIQKQTEMGDQLMGCLGETEVVIACNTYQVKSYDRFEFAPNQAEMKQAYKDAHWQEDLQKAFDAGKRMAEKILLR